MYGMYVYRILVGKARKKETTRKTKMWWIILKWVLER
jgi:hypothetical protein